MLCCAKTCSQEGRGQKEIVEDGQCRFGQTEEAIHILPFKSERKHTLDYVVTSDLEPWGDVISMGQLLYITPGSEVVTREMQMSIYVNGFAMEAAQRNVSSKDTSSRPSIVKRLWSPFSMVEACQVKTPQNNLAWAAFKLTVFRADGDDECLFFATAGQDALAQRDLWMTEMSTGISRVTKSLFPPHSITVSPLRGVSPTSDRILAGYLLYRAGPDTASLVYCELHAYRDGASEFKSYTDEWCTWGVAKQVVTADTIVSSRTREHCTVFGLDDERYSARTKQEKDLWLRALSNIKVKLTYTAPDPSAEELEHIRAAIHEKVLTLKLDITDGRKPALLPTIPARKMDALQEEADNPAVPMVVVEEVATPTLSPSEATPASKLSHVTHPTQPWLQESPVATLRYGSEGSGAPLSSPARTEVTQWASLQAIADAGNKLDGLGEGGHHKAGSSSKMDQPVVVPPPMDNEALAADSPQLPCSKEFDEPPPI
mmetsp:Transcript_70627/g.169242  ORF Transcript_70627/g.169242 Transcript_70627/m.169242 type:complete len:486 (-) Transcript_70627:12-1469(-)